MAVTRIEFSDEIKQYLQIAAYDLTRIPRPRAPYDPGNNKIQQINFDSNASQTTMMAAVVQQNNETTSQSTFICTFPIENISILLQATLKKMQDLLNTLPSDPGSAEGISFVLAVDLKFTGKENQAICPLITNAEGDCKRSEHLSTKAIESYEEVLTSPDIMRSPIVPIADQNMRLDLSINKYKSISTQFLETVSTIDTMSKELFEKPSINVPATCMRKWHFQNFAQGYLLRSLLNSTDTQTLNMMRNLYFVLMTSDTPNITIEFNFKFRHGIFTVYDISSSNAYSQDVMSCNNITSKEKFEWPLSNQSPPEVAPLVKEPRYPKSPSQLSWDAFLKDYFQSKCMSIGVESECSYESIKSRSSMASYVYKKSVALSNCNISLATVEKGVGDSRSPFEYYITQYFPWAAGLINKLENGVDFLVHKYDIANENTFQKVQVDDFASKWKPSDNTAYLIYFGLGQAIGCTLMSFFISLL